VVVDSGVQVGCEACDCSRSGVRQVAIPSIRSAQESNRIALHGSLSGSSDLNRFEQNKGSFPKSANVAVAIFARWQAYWAPENRLH
jgi:hypothetical protein